MCIRDSIGAIRPNANRELFYKKDMGVLARSGFSYDISKKLDNAESPFAFSLPLLFCPLLILGWIYGVIMLIFAPIFGQGRMAF